MLCARVLPLLAVLGLLAVPVASADHSQDVTMHPATIPLSFSLPFYWEKLKAPRGYAFFSRADDLSASLAVAQLQGKVTTNKQLANAAADFLGATYGRIDPSATLQLSRVELPVGSSIRAVVHYHQSVNGATADGLTVVYFLARAKHGYAFAFNTGTRGFENWEPVFRYTARSIRFTGSAI